MVLPPIQYATTEDGVSIAYASLGTGPPLIYLQTHPIGDLAGMLQDEIYAELIGALSQGSQVFLFDNRGAGQSDRDPADVSLAGLLADIDAVVASAGLTTFNLSGELTSVPLAVAYAARHPQAVQRLWLESPLPGDLLYTTPFRELRLSNWELFLQTVVRDVLGFQDEEFSKRTVERGVAAVSA